MHPHPINANLQLIPLAEAATALAHIDAAINCIKDSGLAFEVGPFGTSVEGSYIDIMQLITNINFLMAQRGQQEWLVNIQLHLNSRQAVTASAKTNLHRIL